MSQPRDLNESYIPAGSVGCDHRLYTHAVQFYFDDQVLVRFISEFVISALSAGDSAVILATHPHQRAIADKLSHRGIDVTHYAEEGRYVAIDADEVMTECLSTGMADFSRFRQRIRNVLADVNQAATSNSPQAMVFGELVSLLWKRRQPRAVLTLEKLWNDLATEHTFTLFCGYPVADFGAPGAEDHFLRICASHSTVVSPDQYPSPDAERRLLAASEVSVRR